MEGCHKEVKDETGRVGNTERCSTVRGRKRIVVGMGDLGSMGDMGGKGDQRSRSSWEGRSLSKANAILRRPPGPSQPKVRMFKRIVRLTVLISLLLCIATDGKAGSEGSCGGRMDWSKFDEQATSRTPGGMSRFTFC